MKILVAAMYCRPNSGSEQAYGWWWANELSKAHEVVVVTGSDQRPAIEEALADRDDTENLSFEYVRSLTKQSASGTENRFERFSQYLWQLSAMRRVKRVSSSFKPDVAHHVTSGTWRQPSCLLASGVPYAMGPLAGSERLPPGFARAFGRGPMVYEAIRSAAIGVAKIDPLIRATLGKARAIVAAGMITRMEMQRRYPAKVATFSQVFRHPAIDPAEVKERTWSPGDELRLVWVGRLVPSKGLPILLNALTDKRLPALRLDVLGTGPELENMKSLASSLEIEDLITFHGHVDQEQLFEAISNAHLFVFTSLQELMGQALSEAMQLGAGCIIFDWSGASVLAGSNGALKVPVRAPEHASGDLADAIMDVVENGRVSELSRRALARIDELADDGTPLERMQRLYDFTLGTETKHG